jgi:hemolysin activation/secretion protein
MTASGSSVGGLFFAVIRDSIVFRRLLSALFFYFALIWIVATGWAQDFEKIAPRIPSSEAIEERTQPSKNEVSPGEILVSKLNRVVFLSSQSAVRSSPPPVAGDSLDTRSVPLLQTATFERRMLRYLGKPASLATLENLTASVQRYVDSQSSTLTRVSLPDQELTTGVLQVLVIEQGAGSIRIKGARWSDPRKLLQELRLRPGAPIDVAEAQSGLRSLNRNPFRRIDLTYLPGQTAASTNIELRVREKRPFRAYASYENDGTERSGLDRWRAGFNLGNLWKLEHQFSYQFTSGDSFSDFHANAATYVAPLPWHHIATLFGGWVEDNNPITNTIDNSEDIRLIGLRYLIPLPEFFGLRQDLTLGTDYKESQRTLRVTQGSTNQEIERETAISQFNLGYDAVFNDPLGFTRLSLDLFYSPGFDLPHITDTDYMRVRFGADTEYHYLRGRLDRSFRLPKGFSLNGQVTFQVASEPLLPSEQLTLGGVDYTRGFATSEYNGDRGFRSRVELRSPTITLSYKVGRIQAVAFFDYAYAERLQSRSPRFAEATLSAVGPGLRYYLADWLSVRADYGIRLEDSGLPDISQNRIHIGATVGY